MSFKFAWLSCVEPWAPTPALRHIMAHGVKAIFLQGDTPYSYKTGSAFGLTSTALTASSTVADFVAHHAQQWASDDWAALRAWATANGVPIYYMPDDHEWGGDNWDHTLTQANHASFNIGASDQAAVNAHWWAGIQAARQYMTSNPANLDAGVVINDRPSQALVGDSPPASQYPINYYRVGYDENGNISSTPVIEFFAIDCISYRSPISATDNASKTMIGATQKAWLKTRVVSSSATFKAIMSNKKLFRNLGADNTDTWGFYTTERDEILAHFNSSGVTSAPWLVGDRHVPNVSQGLVSAGAAADALCVCACPTGVVNNTDNGNMTYTNHHTWIYKSAGLKQINVYGLGTVDGEKLTLALRNSETDGVVWSGYIEAGSNTVKYDRPRIA